jgi:cytochrome b561
VGVAAGALWAIPVIAVAFLARTVAIVALRKRRPAAAEVVDKWWVWAPFAVGLVLYVALAVVLILAVPLLGVALTIFGVVVLYFGFFTASSVGSPFRPRR